MQIAEYFRKHEEQAFIAKALVMSLIIIVTKEYLSGLFYFIMFILIPVGFFLYLRLKIITTSLPVSEILKEHLTFIPLMRTAEERRNEKKPWVTYSLIGANIIIFYCLQSNEEFNRILENFILLPEQPTFWNLPLSPLTAMFLHADNGHLWGNMTFLWVVGSAVERRIYSGNFLFLYLFTGLTGGLLYVVVEYLTHHAPGHMIGASGAIAGIMGIFAVRCYFKSMIFPIPILGIFSLFIPINLKVRLNSLVIIGIFFYSDLTGGLAQIKGSGSHIGHWVHLGGMITGMIAATMFLKLAEDAMEERHLEIGIKATETSMGWEEGERSLNLAMEMNPDSAEAILAMARLKSRFSSREESIGLYVKAMNLLIATDPAQALEAFEEYCNRRFPELEPQLLARLGFCAVRLKERKKAVECFSLLADSQAAPPADRERALFQSGKLLEEMGEFERACERYARMLKEFPNADAAPKLRAKLEEFMVTA